MNKYQLIQNWTGHGVCGRKPDFEGIVCDGDILSTYNVVKILNNQDNEICELKQLLEESDKQIGRLIRYLRSVCINYGGNKYAQGIIKEALNGEVGS